MDGWIDEWIDGWMEGWVDGWRDGWMDGESAGIVVRHAWRGSRLHHILAVWSERQFSHL